MAGGPDGAPYYGRARIAAGLICVGAGVILMLVDAASRDYQVDSIQLGLLLGAGLAFLAVEAGRRLLGGP